MSSLTVFVVLAAALATALAQQVQVNTPTSVQSCLPVQLSWTGGVPPYFVGLIAAGQPNSPILKDFGQQTGTTYVWQVDSPAGTSYTVQIRDSQGQLNYSDQFTVQASSQTCATNGTTPSAGSTSATTGTTASAGAAKNSSTSATTPAKNSSTSSTTPSTSGSTSTSSATTPNTASTSSGSSGTTPSAGNATAGSAARTSDAARLSSGCAALGFSLVLALFA